MSIGYCPAYSLCVYPPVCVCARACASCTGWLRVVKPAPESCQGRSRADEEGARESAGHTGTCGDPGPRLVVAKRRDSTGGWPGRPGGAESPGQAQEPPWEARTRPGYEGSTDLGEGFEDTSRDLPRVHGSQVAGESLGVSLRTEVRVGEVASERPGPLREVGVDVRGQIGTCGCRAGAAPADLQRAPGVRLRGEGALETSVPLFRRAGLASVPLGDPRQTEKAGPGELLCL